MQLNAIDAKQNKTKHPYPSKKWLNVHPNFLGKTIAAAACRPTPGVSDESPGTADMLSPGTTL